VRSLPASVETVTSATAHLEQDIFLNYCYSMEAAKVKLPEGLDTELDQIGVCIGAKKVRVLTSLYFSVFPHLY